ncbi:MAG TPA: malto-oligosyltrehalose trehalohydrolase [Gemmatimonadaceae bacterium]|nr:malto-oligosyltrehalose trehalohydrolase [Gemmatimonadaceae bacterium]
MPQELRPWSLSRGATLLAAGATRFSVWCPRAHAVDVVIDRGPAAGRHAMARTDGGAFQVTVARASAGTEYAYSIDGAPPRPDPVSRSQPEGVHGPSRVVDPHAFYWNDAGWTGIAMADYVIYELHVGTFTPDGTFDAVIPELAALARLGITAIELMPVAQFPGERNWGYDGVGLYAPQNSYGGPEGLKRLVDAAHEHGLAMVLDVVYNHLGPEGNYLGEFGPYFTDSYHTPWGSAINYDGPGSDEVRRFVIDNALYWVTEYHVDALRLDAVHGIYDFGARHILEELAHEVHSEARALGRRVQVIAESDLNDPRLVRPRELGGLGLDAQWSDDFHHAVHVALTGERSGYYSDFSGVRDIAEALERRFVYAGRHSAHRGRRHGASATDVSADHFVVAIQNHDQVGNRANGERLSLLLSYEKLRLAAALLLLAPYVPLIFMGEEYGETNPFLYFVSHGDPALVEAVRQGRRREFEHFGWQAEVPDPQATETFERSKLDRGELEEPRHRQILALYGDLLEIRRTESALHPGAASIHTETDPEGECLLVRLTPRTDVLGRGDAGGRDAHSLLALFNFSTREHGVSVGSPAGKWRLRFSTRDARYGGPGDEPGVMGMHGGIRQRMTLHPESAVLYRDEVS